MANYTMTITLGSGEKGKQWDALIRQTARKHKLSVAALVRAFIFNGIKKEMATAQQTNQPVEQQPQEVTSENKD